MRLVSRLASLGRSIIGRNDRATDSKTHQLGLANQSEERPICRYPSE